MAPCKALPHAKDAAAISLDEVVAKGGKELSHEPLSVCAAPLGPDAVFYRHPVSGRGRSAFLPDGIPWISIPTPAAESFAASAPLSIRWA